MTTLEPEGGETELEKKARREVEERRLTVGAWMVAAIKHSNEDEADDPT